MSKTDWPHVHVQDVYLLRNRDEKKMREVRPPKTFKLRNGSHFVAYDAAYVISQIIMKPIRAQRGHSDNTPVPHVVFTKISGVGPNTRKIPASTLFISGDVVSLSSELEVSQ